MARRDLSNRDISDHASGELDSVLHRQSAAAKPKIKKITAEEAMNDARVVQHASTRDVTRVLFVSQATELLNPTKQTLDGYLNISDVFDEVHILVLRQGIEPRQPVFRPESNVFIYTVATRFWWLMPVAGIDMIKAQLVFASGFRPDLIVARDPFESSIVALWAARKYGRPAQLHVMVNFFHASFLELASANRWRRLIARFTCTRFLSIRVATDRILKQLVARTDIADISRLPQLNPYETLAKQEQTLDLKQKYRQYVFTILYVGSLNDTVAVFRAIDAARYMLRNPRVAMIIMGDGSARGECERRVKALGIEEQVIFEYRSLDRVQYLKAAHLLLVTATDEESEEIVLQAAGAKIPMVLIQTEKRDDLFTHRESAYLCDADDVQAHSDGVHDLMEGYELRQQIAEQAYVVVTKAMHQDPEAYRKEYRASIEAALFAEEVVEVEGENTESAAAEVESAD